jgi:serine/alanine adding enzyme
MTSVIPGIDPRVELLRGGAVSSRMDDLVAFAMRRDRVSLSHHPHWLWVLRDGLGHVPMVLTASQGRQLTGYLPLAFIRSTLFGRFLVSLPYLNTGGVDALSHETGQRLIGDAVALAERLRVKYLELRHEEPTPTPLLDGSLSTKVHMRLELPSFPGQLW